MSLPMPCPLTLTASARRMSDADLRDASRFERDWKNLTAQQRATFTKVIEEAFVPDLIVPDRPFRPGLRVKGRHGFAVRQKIVRIHRHIASMRNPDRVEAKKCIELSVAERALLLSDSFISTKELRRRSDPPARCAGED